MKTEIRRLLDKNQTSKKIKPGRPATKTQADNPTLPSHGLSVTLEDDTPVPKPQKKKPSNILARLGEHWIDIQSILANDSIPLGKRIRLTIPKEIANDYKKGACDIGRPIKKFVRTNYGQKYTVSHRTKDPVWGQVIFVRRPVPVEHKRARTA